MDQPACAYVISSASVGGIFHRVHLLCPYPSNPPLPSDVLEPFKAPMGIQRLECHRVVCLAHGVEDTRHDEHAAGVEGGNRHDDSYGFGWCWCWRGRVVGQSSFIGVTPRGEVALNQV